jgi:hypothetical protein
MEWTDATEDTPKEDGRYAIIYQQGSTVRRVFCDYSTEDGWLIGMMDVKVLAWCRFPDIPQWLIDNLMEEVA